MPDFTRLGTPPADRPGTLRSATGQTCPDILIAGTRVLVIGEHLQGGDLLWLLPPTAGVGPGETVVEIPIGVFDAAARDRLADARLAASEAQGQTARDQEQHGAQIAYRIRAELVCCRVYGVLNDDGRIPLPSEVREVEATGHGLCYWSEAAARIAETPPQWQDDPDECAQGCPKQCRHRRAADELTRLEEELT